MNLSLTLGAAFLAGLVSFASGARAQADKPAPAQPAAPKPAAIQPAPTTENFVYVIMKTSSGDVALELNHEKAPVSVENFLYYTDKKFYDGTIFHRVIPNFMIQGGDPEGGGRGGPGYKFEDEFQSGRGFDKVGLLAMANAGPGTNGSQFFITTSTPTYLNNRHTIFGEVVQGYDVVEKISNVERLPGDRPVKEVVIKSLTISDKGPAKAPAPKAAAAAEPAKEKK